MLWNILSDEFVCIFNRSFLPRGIRIGEIDDRSQILCNELVCGKFRAVVSGYGFDVFLVGLQQTSDSFGQRLGLLPMGKFGHEEHVCGTLHDREYGVVVRIHNQIHLKIPKAFSVRLLGTRVNTCSIGNGERLVFGAAPIFELVARQFPACIGVDQVVDALCETLTPSFFNTPDICRGDHCSSMMSCLTLHTNSGVRAALRVERLRRFIALSCALNQIYLPDRVLLRFNSRESVDWLIPTIRAISFLGHFLCSKAKICDLCSKVSCLYIRNTKIINLRESSKGDSFFVLPVSLFGATRPGREANPRCFS